MNIYLRVSDAERDAGRPLAGTLDQAEQIFLAQGCLVLENALPLTFVHQLQAAYQAGMGALDDGALLASGLVVGVRRVMVPQALVPPFDTPYFWAHPIFCTLMSRWLSERFVLDVSSIVTALPGAPVQTPHRDNAFPYGFSEISVQMPPCGIVMSIPLIDLDESTGLTEFFAGSHRQLLGSQAYPAGSGLRPQLKLGDVSFWDYRLVHSGTPNTSSRRRPLITLVYTRPWYIDTLNHLDQNVPSLIVPEQLLSQLPEPLAHLLSRAPGARNWQRRDQPGSRPGEVNP